MNPTSRNFGSPLNDWSSSCNFVSSSTRARVSSSDGRSLGSSLVLALGFALVAGFGYFGVVFFRARFSSVSGKMGSLSRTSTTCWSFLMKPFMNSPFRHSPS